MRIASGMRLSPGEKKKLEGAKGAGGHLELGVGEAPTCAWEVAVN